MLEINKAIENLKNAFNSDKRMKILLIIGAISILLILLSEVVPINNSKAQESENITSDYTQYVNDLEDRTAEIIGSINGVGKCKVMITLKNSNEFVYAKNIEESSNESSYSKNYEYVLHSDNNGDVPIVLKEFYPEIQGIAVVCEGADDIVVKENVINSLSSLYGLPTSKISISKLK